MKIFASKPTKQDIFISIIIFLFGILFYIGMSKFRGIGKDKKPKSDTIFMKCDSLTYFIFELPKNYKTGTPIESHIHFSNEQGHFKINNIFDYEIKKPSFIKRLINKDARTYVYVKCPEKSIVNAIDVHYQVNAR